MNIRTKGAAKLVVLSLLTVCASYIGMAQTNGISILKKELMMLGIDTESNNYSIYSVPNEAFPFLSNDRAAHAENPIFNLGDSILTLICNTSDSNAHVSTDLFPYIIIYNSIYNYFLLILGERANQNSCSSQIRVADLILSFNAISISVFDTSKSWIITSILFDGHFKNDEWSWHVKSYLHKMTNNVYSSCSTSGEYSEFISSCSPVSFLNINTLIEYGHLAYLDHFSEMSINYNCKEGEIKNSIAKLILKEAK